MKLTFPFHIEFGIGPRWLAAELEKYFRTAECRPLVITGKTVSSEYAARVCCQLSIPVTCMAVGAGSLPELHALEAEVRNHDHTHILSIGGGRVGDFSKRLALLSNLRLVLAPTIIANDGLISPIAVLRDEQRTVSLAGKMPDAVFIDIEVLKKSPAKYLVAAACDLASNISATNDWERFSPADAHRNSLANYLSQAAADGVIWCADWNVASDTFLERVILGQILSGLAMALAGSSRPCSGSEHLICHALEQFGLCRNLLHGTAVASATRFALALQDSLDGKIVDFLRHFDIPTEFPGSGALDDADLARLFAAARRTRPGRRTILDSFTDRELVIRYRSFTRRAVPLSRPGGSALRKIAGIIDRLGDDAAAPIRHGRSVEGAMTASPTGVRS